MGHSLSYWHFARHTPRSVKNSKGPNMVRAGGPRGGGQWGGQGQANRALTSSFRSLHIPAYLTDPYRPLRIIAYPCILLHTLTDPYRQCISLHTLTYPYRLRGWGQGQGQGGGQGGGARAPFWALTNILGGCVEQSANMIR